MSPSQTKSRRGFKYSPLQSNSFRLLELIPARSLVADIHCRLRDYQLDAAPPYEALSYTWGDEKSTCRISLNGLSFQIRPNLRDVLRRLRRPRNTRIIWIDAICIDQNNTVEKSVQVPLMGNIYSRAQRVVAWLGEETFDSEKAIEFIPYLTEVTELDDELLWLIHIGDDEFLRQMASLADLFARPWWQRMWIVQEVALAQDVVVLCGSRHVPWSTFYSFITAWMNHQHVPLHKLEKLPRVAFRRLGMYVSGFSEALAGVHQSRQTTSKPELLELPNLIWSFKDQAVTNPSDKIYGLLGLLDEHGVQVDYNKSSEDIYLSFFTSCLLKDKGLDWFRWLTGEHYQSTELRLPSWVPDFGPRSLRPISSFLPNGDLGEQQRSFSASGPDRSRSLFSIQFGDPRTLILRGRLFDVVSKRGRIYPSSDAIVLAGRATKTTFSRWKKMAMDTQTEIYKSCVAKEDAFWRTILTDRQMEGLHFKGNAGWIPANRFPVKTPHIPPKTAKQERDLLQTMEHRPSYFNGRRFCITRKGHFCLLPPTASIGDLICVLLGGEVPHVLRRVDDCSQDSYTMVGECYVHGIMDGEAITDILEGKDEGDIFRLC